MASRKFFLKGGSLQYVVVLGILLASLCFSFLILMDSRELSNQNKWLFQNVKRENKEQIIAALMGTTTKLGATIENTIRSSYFGLLEIYSQRRELKGKIVEDFAYVGHHDPSEVSLYLKNTSSFPLYVVGNSSIMGDIMIPASGLKIGTLGSKGFTGKLNVYNQKVSQEKLPKIKPELRRQLDKLLNKDVVDKIPFFHFTKGDQIERSFGDPTLILNISNLSVLENITLIGNIEIHSDQPIYISNSAKLYDVVLSAPSIEIESFTKGQFQAVASKKIKVGKNCFFNYPSVFWVHDNTEKSDSVSFVLEQGTVFKGIMGLTVKNPKSDYYLPSLVFHSNTNITGQVYSELPVALHGNLFGSLFTEKIVSTYQNKLYINHMIDGNILGKLRPTEFAGILFEESRPNVIVKWLY